MNRKDFIGYLAPRASDLKIRLHREGKLLGLPLKFHQALAMVYLLDALGRRAPSSQTLRSWYGDEALGSPDVAKWIYDVTGALQDADLEKLRPNELTAIGFRLTALGATAHGMATDAARKAHKRSHQDPANLS